MVLRPTLLRYKGKTQPVETGKMQQIASRAQAAQKEIHAHQIVPKTMLWIGFCGFIVFAAPMAYFSFQCQSTASQRAVKTEREASREKAEGELLLLSQN